MPRILADHNVEGHLRVLIRICSSPNWSDVWAAVNCEIDSFARLGLPHDTADDELWQLCQQRGIMLVTGNRNADGPNSLEMTIRSLGTDKSLPVITIGNPD